MSKQTKSSSPTEKGTYGRLPLEPKSRRKEKTLPNSDNKNTLLRKKNKMESAAKKSGSSRSGKSIMLKGKTKHHVAKVSRKTIKERLCLVADKNSSKVAKAEKRFGNCSLGPHFMSSPKLPKKKRKIKTKRNEFQMNITDSNHDYFLRPENVPWYKAEEQERFRENITPCKEYAKSNSSQSKSGVKGEKEFYDDKEALLLPSDEVLSQIDVEILSFCAYVKLTPSEWKARTSFLGHITDILTSQFSSRGKGLRSHRPHRIGYKSNEGGVAEEAKGKIYVEPFGSFATQEVCTFASDVDMCIWGLVEKEEMSNSHLRFVSCDSGNNNDEDDMNEISFLNKPNQQSECPLLTESSLLRTMDAIQSSAQGKKPTTEECVNNEKAGCAEENGVENSDPVNHCNDCFFVIDRVGETSEMVEEEEELGRNILHANKHSSYGQRPNNVPNIDLPTCKERKGYAHQNTMGNSPEAHFQFVIDDYGVKELGGDVDDLCNETQDTFGGEEPSATPISIHYERRSEEKPEHVTEEQEDSGNETDPIAVLDSPFTGKQCQAVTDHFESIFFQPTTSLGKSRDTAIEVDDCSTGDERSEVIFVDDDDSADKLESFYCRQNGNNCNGSHSSNESYSSKFNGKDCLVVGDSSEDPKLDNFDHVNKVAILELSVTSNTIAGSSDATKQLVKPVFGPTGKTRARVISVLQGLTNHLRRSSFTNTVECRSRARVPIINCNTRTGFEGDIAIGGHNGVDTSTYALRQTNRFYSFAPIVLVLKVLMVQQGLDKPFTGGLGSYKLYVLVAHHIECHLANGGCDRPSEILISLLFRYSYVGSPDDKSTTDLEAIRNSDGMISSDDGICDLTPVFRIPDVIEMFRECHERLFDRLLLAEGFDDGQCSVNLSYLSSMIDCFRLKEARESSDRRSRLCDDICRPIARDHPGKVSASRRVGKVFSKHDSGMEPKRQRDFSDSAANKRRRSGSVMPRTQHLNRGPRGGLIPLQRPDLVAMRSIRADPEKELLLRGTKNRKNKKKQARDDALRAFANRSI